MGESRLSIRSIVPSERSALRGLFLLVPVIAVAALFGRPLERSFPFLIYLLPSVGFVAFLFHSTSLALLFLKARPIETFGMETATLVVATLATPFLFVAASMLLIEHPIERIHILKYGALGYLLSFCLPRRLGWRRIGLGFLGAALIGTLEESAQLFIPERRFDRRDIGLNVVSASIGALYAGISLRISGLVSGRIAPDTTS